MDLISELESEFSSLTETHAVDRIQVRTGEAFDWLAFPELGIDYLAGLSDQKILVFPITAISAVMGSSLPKPQPITLEQFLERQKTPVRVSYQSGSVAASGWLLNVGPGWIRVAVAKELSWLPLAVISKLEIWAVDNSIRQM